MIRHSFTRPSHTVQGVTMFKYLFSVFFASFLVTHPVFDAKQIGVGKPLIFNSGNPIDFSQFLISSRLVMVQPLIGYLSMPKQVGEKKVPAVVIMSGSGGIQPWMNKYVHLLNGMGVATFQVDSFMPRDVKEVATNQAAVTLPMMTYDAFAALKFVSKFPHIDKNKIAILGWSKGGGVTQITAFSTLQKAMMGNDGVKFAAHIMYYPACKLDYPDYEVDGSPWLYMHGAKDDYTRVSNCLPLLAKLKNKIHISKFIYPDAYHDFDKDSQPVVWAPKLINPKRCRGLLNTYWALTEEYSGLRINSLQHYEEAYKKCELFGVHLGFNKKASDDSKHRLVNFVKKYLIKAS